MTNYINRFDSVLKPFDSLFEYEINGMVEGPSKMEFNMAGIKKNDISLSVEGNLLRVKGSNEENERKYSKVVQLPQSVDVDSITATYKNGLLVVDMNKKSTEKIIDII